MRRFGPLPRRLFLWCFGLGLLLPAAGAPAQDAVRLQLRWRHQFQFAGYYAAQARGFFADAGFRVEIREGAVNLDPIREVVEGRADFGVGNSELVLHYLDGVPVVAVATIFQHSPLVLMSRAEENIRHPQDLVGRRVKMLLAPRDAELMAMFQREGVPLDALDVVQGWVIPEDYWRPDLAAISAYVTNEPYFLQSRGISVQFLRPSTYGIDFYGDTLFTRREIVAEDPERVQRFRDACLQGWEYAMAHPREIIRLIQKEYETEKTFDHLQYEADTLRDLIQPELVQVGYMNPGRWQHIADTFVRLGMAEPGPPLAEFTFSPETGGPAWLETAIWIAGVLILGAALMTGGLLLYSHRLSRAVADRTRSLTRLNNQLLEEVEERRRAEAALNRLQEALEERIQERTLELETANRRLRNEVTQRRETEQALRDSQAEKQAILDGISSHMVFMDRERRIRWANRSLADFFGYTPDALIGIPCHVLWGTPDRTCRDCPTRQSLETAAPARGAIRMPDGRLWDKRAEPVLDDGGHLVGVLEISDDVTERQRLADQLQHLRQMQAVGELAAGVAHEFNNALFGITGHIELMRKTDDRPETVRRHAEQVLAAADRMIRMTERLLAYAQNGRFDLSPLSLNDFLRRLMDRQLAPDAVARKMRLEADPDEVAADPEQLERALSAVLANAEEALPDGGLVEIRTWNRAVEAPPPAEAKWIRPGPYVVVSVRDDGPGMEAQVRERVFEPFFSTKFRGRGLGLSSAFGIVRNHGGWMEVISEMKRGTEVRLHLSALTAEAPPESPSEGAPGEEARPATDPGAAPVR
jgi:PAS domain S-box-containing protein